MITDKELDLKIEMLKKIRRENKLSDEAKQRIKAKLDEKLKNS